MPRAKLSLEIFLIALAIILVEISYTRVFSFKLVYYFTYLIIGIALLGLGAGSVAVAMSARIRATRAGPMLALCCLGGGISVGLGYLLVAGVQFNSVELVRALASWNAPQAIGEGVRLVLLCLALFAPFLFGGMAIAMILSSQPERIHRLYFADLLGAGLGCALSVPLMQWISPPGCVVLAGSLFAAAGLRGASGVLRASLAAIAALMLFAALFPSHIPDPVVDRGKTMGSERKSKSLFSRWSPVFRVDVLESEVLSQNPALALIHDGMWGSILPKFDGDLASLTRYGSDIQSLPFALLPPEPRVGIIGSAGGNEILASLHFEASHITGVELNPVTVSLLEDHFADYTGRVAQRPRVDLVNAEGRSFLMGTDRQFDLIWFVAPDSYAAMNAATSGAFVLSESYLYTVEMVEESLNRTSDEGMVCVQFGEVDFARKPNRTARYLNTAREAFRRLGFPDFHRHVLVATSPGFFFSSTTILLSRAPFNDARIRAFAERSREIGGEPRYLGRDVSLDARLSTLIAGSASEVERWQDEYPFDVSVVTDDAPFFWHFVPFRLALGRLDDLGIVGNEEGMGERLLMVLLVVATGFAGVFLLLPVLARPQVWRNIPYKGSAFVYFAALGLGFMFLEVSLIQRLTLFLGYPTYSLTVTLFALLISTAVGSLWSGSILRRNRALAVLAGLLVAVTLFYGLALPALVRHFIGSPIAIRIALAIALLSPLGLILGAFMPLGLRTVAGLTDHAQEYVAWGWAVNGFFSVVSSVLSTILAMTFGFNVVMLLALATYGVGIAALGRIPEPTSAALHARQTRSAS